MFNRLLFTIATAVCLTGLYAVYAVTTRPLVVVPDLPSSDVEPTRQNVAHRPPENVRVAETYLPEQRWAAQSEYMLRAGQSFIYTKKWKHHSGDQRIQFSPFAMVWLQKDKQGREQAVSLVSDSAQLKFAAAFDEVNPNPGRVVGAVLDGDVQIRGPDGLMIAGKQFVFDESAPSLVSTNLVQFQYGSHYGRARNLNMKLIPAEGVPGRDRPHVFGIRTIRLGSGTDPETKKFEDVRLDIRMPQQGQQKLVKVQCKGDLEYDVEMQTATFSNSVRAYSWTGPDYDALDCDELWLQFERSAAATIAAATPLDAEDSDRAFQRIETDLAFRKLVAKGRLVVIQSTQNGVKATMNRLEYDASQNCLHLSDPRNVYVEQKGSLKLMVPDLQVRLRHDNSVDEILCRGVGRLEMSRSGSSDLAFIASWAQQLRKSTDPANGLDLIELEKQALFRQPLQQTGLGAELVRLWLAPMTVNLPGAGAKPEPTPEPQPKRLVAERDVALISPQLVARTGELDVTFDETVKPAGQARAKPRDNLQLVGLEVEPGRPPAARSRAPGGIVPASATRSNPPGSLGPPIDIPLSTTDGQKALPGVGSSKPLEVTADKIAVRMQQLEQDTSPELVEVETHGHVKIIQRRTGEASFTAEGDRMRLQNRGREREIVDLFGQPAHLRDRGLHVEGRTIHLDREANLVSVKGSGLLQLPVPPGTELESLGQATNDPDMDVLWQEEMEFDGRTAKFIGKVRAELGLSRLRCEQMDVSLSSRLSFTEEETTKPELRGVHCREDVSFENSAYEGNRLVRVQRGHVAEFILDRQKESTFAQGPGQLLVWQRGKGNQVGLPQRDVIQANRPISAVTADWNFTQVNFKGRMTGKIDQQRSTFHNSVRIVHGPVSLPNETIDADHMTADAGSMRCDKLEFIHKSKSEEYPKDYQQLVGIGNARIEGRGFYANADEISFDGAKGLYMLRAYGNQTATIAMDTNKGTRNDFNGRRIDFIPATSAVKVDWSTGASGGP